MPGFSDPLWLVALVTIPVIHWLHRWYAPLSAWPVSAIFLWDRVAEDDAAGRVRRPADPAWRRRALASALLVLALANPYWQGAGTQLTVWVDDSLSMQTMEDGETRLETLFALLADALGDESDYDALALRSLTDPGNVRSHTAGDDPDIGDWRAVSETEPLGPPGPLMSPTSSHWLLSDGASSSVQSWAARVRLDRVLQTGSITENAALSHLAARRNLDSPDLLDVLVTASNRGRAAVTRKVALYSGDRVLDATDLTLDAGESRHWQTQVAVAGPSIRASLSPGDALRQDDALSISLEQFAPLAIMVDLSCGPALRHAVASHPSLVASAADATPDIELSCPRDAFPPTSPRGARAHIRALAATPLPLTAAPVWTGYGREHANLRLAPAWLSAAPWPGSVGAPRDFILIESNDSPLVILRDAAALRAGDSDQRRVVDTVLDLQQARFAGQPEYAAFVGVLLDLATGRNLLTETVTASREPQNSNVAPRNVSAVSAMPVRVPVEAGATLATPLLVAALLLLLLDAILFLRSRRGARRA